MRTTVHTTIDRSEAHAIVAMLEGEGLEVELVGVVDAARIGVGEAALPLRIEVAAEDEAHARELISARPVEPIENTEPSRRLKRGLIALGVPVVWPGLGHVYAGRPYTGVMLGLGVLGAIVANGPLSGAYPLLLMFDAFFAFRAVKAFNAGKYQNSGTQLLVGVGLVSLAFFIVGAQPMREAVRRATHERELARVQVTCRAGQLVATNVGDEPRDVELAGLVSARVVLMQADDVVGLEASGARRAVLEPGGALTLTVQQEPRGVFVAEMPSLLERRSFRVELIVRRVGSAENVRGTAYCTP